MRCGSCRRGRRCRRCRPTSSSISRTSSRRRACRNRVRFVYISDPSLQCLYPGGRRKSGCVRYPDVFKLTILPFLPLQTDPPRPSRRPRRRRSITAAVVRSVPARAKGDQQQPVVEEPPPRPVRIQQLSTRRRRNLPHRPQNLPNTRRDHTLLPRRRRLLLRPR